MVLTPFREILLHRGPTQFLVEPTYHLFKEAQLDHRNGFDDCHHR